MTATYASAAFRARSSARLLNVTPGCAHWTRTADPDAETPTTRTWVCDECGHAETTPTIWEARPWTRRFPSPALGIRLYRDGLPYASTAHQPIRTA